MLTASFLFLYYTIFGSAPIQLLSALQSVRIISIKKQICAKSRHILYAGLPVKENMLCVPFIALKYKRIVE